MHPSRKSRVSPNCNLWNEKEGRPPRPHGSICQIASDLRQHSVWRLTTVSDQRRLSRRGTASNWTRPKNDHRKKITRRIACVKNRHWRGHAICKTNCTTDPPNHENIASGNFEVQWIGLGPPSLDDESRRRGLQGHGNDQCFWWLQKFGKF